MDLGPDPQEYLGASGLLICIKIYNNCITTIFNDKCTNWLQVSLLLTGFPDEDLQTVFHAQLQVHEQFHQLVFAMEIDVSYGES